MDLLNKTSQKNLVRRGPEQYCVPLLQSIKVTIYPNMPVRQPVSLSVVKNGLSGKNASDSFCFYDLFFVLFCCCFSFLLFCAEPVLTQFPTVPENRSSLVVWSPVMPTALPMSRSRWVSRCLLAKGTMTYRLEGGNFHLSLRPSKQMLKKTCIFPVIPRALAPPGPSFFPRGQRSRASES